MPCSNYIDKQAINDRGKIRIVDKTLDEPEQRGAGHWAGKSGPGLYCLERVELAESIIAHGNGTHLPTDLAVLANQSVRPVTEGCYAIDFRKFISRLFKVASPIEIPDHLRGPFVSTEGRLERSQFYMVQLINSIDPSIKTWKAGNLWMNNRVDSALDRLGKPWPNVVSRVAYLRSYSARGSSESARLKLMDVLTVLHSGQVEIKGSGNDLISLITESNVLRFDPIFKSI